MGKDTDLARRRLVVVTGANGAIGRAYLGKLCSAPGTSCIAVSRDEAGVRMNNVDDLYISNLMDEQETQGAMDGISLENVDEVIFLHPVGKFKFEEDGPENDDDLDGIDDEVLSSNLDTFVFAADPLIRKVHEQSLQGREVSLVLCAFGSVSDRENPPLWQSYSESKNRLRALMQDAESLNARLRISTVFINVSTVDTGNENILRPNVTEEEKLYWLNPEDVVDRSMPTIEQTLQEVTAGSHERWHEIDIVEHNPEHGEGYYSKEKALPRWQRAMQRK